MSDKFEWLYGPRPQATVGSLDMPLSPESSPVAGSSIYRFLPSQGGLLMDYPPPFKKFLDHYPVMLTSYIYCIVSMTRTTICMDAARAKSSSAYAKMDFRPERSKDWHRALSFNCFDFAYLVSASLPVTLLPSYQVHHDPQVRDMYHQMPSQVGSPWFDYSNAKMAVMVVVYIDDHGNAKMCQL